MISVERGTISEFVSGTAARTETPRTVPDLRGGDGFDVLAGRARVLDQHGQDLTEAMMDGARAMLAFAKDG